MSLAPKRLAAAFSLAILAACGTSVALGNETASQQLSRIAEQANQRSLDLFPVAETFRIGAGPRQGKLEAYFSDEHRERQRAHHRLVLEQLRHIAPGELNATDAITHRLLSYRSLDSLEFLELPFHQHFIFIQLGGGIAFGLVRLVGTQPFRNEEDYRAWISRLKQYPSFMDTAIAVMRDGMRMDLTIPRVLVQRSLGQLEGLAPAGQDLAKSTLWKPVLNFPGTMDEAARKRIEGDYRELLLQEVFPGMRRLAKFVREEYLPMARTSDGLDKVRNGERMYRLLVRSETTTDLAPDEIHQSGLSEVKRIQGVLLAVAGKEGFKGEVKDLRAWLRTNPENFPFTTGDQVIDYLRAIHEKIVPRLTTLFGRFPKARFEIRLTDPAIAASAPAQWYPPADDGSRPGVFAMPVVDAKQRSKVGLASLLAHEGMPGHHFDGGLQRELKVPEFRRHQFINAFGEGWALYAESLGHEIGLYDQPLDLIGRYLDELFRAARLVIDTGLHSRGWTREQAIRYLMEQAGSSEDNATSEVLRYMAWPGQALGYKIGELTIRDLRTKAEKRLGRRFDVRAFHDAILGEGHLPLGMLRERMDAWIEDEAGKK